MTDPLQSLLIALSLVVAALAAVYVALDRPTGPVLLGSLGLLEGGLLVQAVVGIAQLVRDDPGVNGLVFVGYLLGTLLFVPAAAWWALGERSRAGTAALVVVGLVVPVLILRIEQIWTAPGA
jgi:hypothetical protein